MKVGVVATVTVRDGRGPDYEELFRRIKALVQDTEPGTLVYELTRSRDNPNQYTALSVYADEAALALHGRAEGMAAVSAGLMPLLDGAPKMAFLDVIE